MAKTAGSHAASWAVVGVLGLAVALQPVACKTPTSTETDPILAQMLADIGGDVVLPTLDASLASVRELETATQAWAAAPDDADALTQARTAWRLAMTDWQRAEVMQIGPLASALHAQGGQNGRDNIYSWPTTNPCRVDQETVSRGFEQADWSDTALVNVIGLDAIEYLLWAEPDNACPSQVDINADGSWDALGEAQVQVNRADYAAALAALLTQTLEEQRDEWESFGDELPGAGESTSVYATPDSAMNAVYDALFYLEIATKDLKLAKPLGLIDCGEPTCPEAAEHRLSGHSAEAIAANIEGFELLFTGGDGTGLDAVLDGRGHGDLAQSVTEAITQAKANAAALTLPIDEGVASEPQAVQAVHDDLKQISDLLKGDIATVLSMSLPSEAAGDND